jgi:chemotaxis protein MotA
VKNLNLSSIIGLMTGIFLVVFGIAFNQTTMSVQLGTLGNFFDIPSIIITIGGTFTTLLTMEKSLQNYLAKLKSIRLIFKNPSNNVNESIARIIELSNSARKEGLLSLEESAGNLGDDFLKRGVMLIVDGTDPELVRKILETELSYIESRHNETITFWKRVASMGPAWGMIGTLIGLVNMLKNMSDASSIGGDMAVALITTFYGSVLANLLGIPIANKLKLLHDVEIQEKELMVEGILSIQAGENPSIIEEKLKSFIRPSMRKDGENNVRGEAVE